MKKKKRENSGTEVESLEVKERGNNASVCKSVTFPSQQESKHTSIDRKLGPSFKPI